MDKDHYTQLSLEATDDTCQPLTEDVEESYGRLSKGKARPEYADRLLEAEHLRKLLADKLQYQRDLQQEINKVKPTYEIRRNQLLNDIVIKETQICAAHDTINRLEYPVDLDRPPGPKSLWWVESSPFMVFSTGVILLNTSTIVLETLHKHDEEEFFWYDQSFMAFYILELVLKACVWKHRFLVNNKSMWWHWLDVGIVASGIMDMYLQPLLVLTGLISGKSQAFSSASRLIRFCRLLRILKILHAFFHTDLTWTAEPGFQLFIMSIIGINSLVMGFETDFPDFWLWIYADQLFLIIFTFELACRLKLQGCEFFHDPDTVVWNYIDFTIVVGGIVDQWAMPTITFFDAMMLGIHSDHGNNIGQVMMLLRMLRLLRLLRLVRLVKNIPPLFNLVVGIVKAVQGMIWVLLLTATFLYTCSLLCVHLFGHGLVFDGEPPEEVSSIFPNVFQSFFILFKLMNGDGDALEPLFSLVPWSKAFFLFYMVLSSWAILSILTAVVSENMIAATETHRGARELEQEQDRQIYAQQKVRQLFSQIDRDGSLSLTRVEFMRFVQDPVQCQELRSCFKANLDCEDLVYLFNAKARLSECGDENKDYIEINDFYDAMERSDDFVKQRAVYKLSFRIRGLERGIRHSLEDIMQKLSTLDGGGTASAKDGYRNSGVFKHKLLTKFFDESRSLEDVCGLARDTVSHEMQKALLSVQRRSSRVTENL